MKLMMRISLAFVTNKRICFIDFSNEVDNGGALISLISVFSSGFSFFLFPLDTFE